MPKRFLEDTVKVVVRKGSWEPGVGQRLSLKDNIDSHSFFYVPRTVLGALFLGVSSYHMLEY